MASVIMHAGNSDTLVQDTEKWLTNNLQVSTQQLNVVDAHPKTRKSCDRHHI